MATVLTVNSAHVGPGVSAATTGIDKRPIDGAVAVRAPGPMHGGLGSGLIGDTIGNAKVHGGDDQAVYAYAREDYDRWQARLSRRLANGPGSGDGKPIQTRRSRCRRGAPGRERLESRSEEIRGR